MVAAKRAYLAAYNVVLAFGWCQVLAVAACELALWGPAGVYVAVQGPLKLWQTAALLEVVNSLLGESQPAFLGLTTTWVYASFAVHQGRSPMDNAALHAYTRIVRSPLSATVPQVASRLFVLWGILHGFPEVQGCWQVSTLVVSWSLAEIVRYSYFALKEAGGASPPALQWLRYSAFGALYPTGIASEVALIYLALPHIKTTRRYNLEMPNALNFAFDFYWASLAALGCYIPGAPFMYTYMLAQRRKVLGKAKAA
eukprot:SM000241S08525  [mRNA]  locus=s241:98128:100276:- [translate_table: standard]